MTAYDFVVRHGLDPVLLLGLLWLLSTFAPTGILGDRR